MVLQTVDGDLFCFWFRHTEGGSRVLMPAGVKLGRVWDPGRLRWGGASERTASAESGQQMTSAVTREG